MTVDTVIVVRGSVQGVGFRWWTRRRLAELGLEGSATNLPDGTVEVRVRGETADVQRLVRTLRSGSTPGHVTDVQLVEPTTADVGPAPGSAPLAVAERAPDHDVVIVGAGPAGLSAALVLGRSRRRVLVVDDGAPRNRFAQQMHGYLGHDGTPPEEFLALGVEEASRYGVEVRRGRATRLLPAPTENLVEVTLDHGHPVTARRVLVTTGLTDQLPDVAGLTERWGRDVLHCPYCHGWEYRDATLAVLAEAPDEVDKALTVRQWSGAVTLVLHGLAEEDLPAVTRERLAATGVEVVIGRVEELAVRRDRVVGLRLADGRTVACDAVVVQPRMVARDELLVQVGVEVRSGPFGEFVVTDDQGSTGVPGVWAAGNVTEPGAQVVVAAGAGYRAAVAIDHDLVLEDVDAAVSARREADAVVPAPPQT